MQSKTTRAFRTISEAGEELGLQPHVLRFWESKFPDIKPIKRGGGRRFYRPEDIEFLRGIKILLHEEKHPIKDVQKLIRLKGAASVVDLGRSVEQAAKPKDIKDTVLIPERIQNAESEADPSKPAEASIDIQPHTQVSENNDTPKPSPFRARVVTADQYNKSVQTNPNQQPKVSEHKNLEDALTRVQSLKARWDDFLEKYA